MNISNIHTCLYLLKNETEFFIYNFNDLRINSRNEVQKNLLRFPHFAQYFYFVILLGCHMRLEN